MSNVTNIKAKTFIETIKIFKAKKEEVAIPLHNHHHLQVEKSLNEFKKEQFQRAVENQAVDIKLGPQSKQALGFLDACSRVDFLNDIEKEKIQLAKNAIRESKFIELQREINRHKNLSKKVRLKLTQTVDGLLKIITKYPLENMNLNKKSISETIPEIIISESYN